MANKKVLFLLHIPPPVHGSSMVGKYIKESELINQAFVSRYVNLLASKEVRYSGKASLQKIVGVFILFYRLLKELIYYKPDLCYLALTTTGFAFYRDVILVVLIRTFRVKRIFHLHNKGVVQHDKSWFNKKLYEFVFWDAEVILLSKFLYADVEAYVLPENVHVCANGIPEKTGEAKLNRFSEAGLVKILFLSNLIETKGVYILLEACKILKEGDIQVSIDFIGGEGDISAEQFEAKARELGLDTVRYLGKKFGEEKNRAFKEADIFAFPTYYPNECFPLVLLEAMQHGLPVVSTPEGGIADIVEDSKTGFLVPQRSAEQVATKLKFLIQNPDVRVSMGKAGRQRYEENFKLNTFERKLSQIIKQVTEAKSTARRIVV
ncbi:glycosyltransferase family 4 protein [Sunxiuqinia rutila]|uniref:glycosyltransferase family 4 protein n=1 Tax=Sunxiuqinia rutila TaxID=1397841 RepID=UPI003D359DEB